MKKYSKARLAALAVAVVVIAAVILLIENPSRQATATGPNTGTSIGQVVPDIEFQTFAGDAVKISDFRGKTIIINSWAGWCPFCIDEIPDLQRVSNELEDVVILFVHRTKTEPLASGVSYLEALPRERGIEITDPILQDPSDSFYTTFFGFGMPVSVFVDSSGVIRDKKVGPMDESEIRERLSHIVSVESRAVVEETNRIKTLPDGTRYIIHPSEIFSGGPPKGGIGVDIGIAALVEQNIRLFPADHEENAWLGHDSIILSVEVDGEVRGYPFLVLVWHEIANDVIAGKPVLVTYCPLCGTGIAFERAVGGEAVRFGTSGKLWKANLVMYDEKTDSYWSQVTGEAIVGPLTGTKLKRIPSETITWRDFKAKHPNALVLSKNTGMSRRYGTDPYTSFYSDPAVGFGVSFTDTRLFSKEYVYGIELGDAAKAYPWREVAKAGLLNDNVAGNMLLVVSNPASGAVRVFNRLFEGEVLEFRLDNATLLDSKGREWGFDGRGPADKSLEELVGVNAFWFSWLETHSETELYKA